ncbi:MAG TPA: hypothetical protein PKA54_03560 [Chitinophagaceae bacterium]|nr:MAG: hypothetical protein UZ11_BCD004000599 [Bacteroidetes bacterium OLB11]HMN32424.1 hypothetical protein [Chitinophagaceae bacterium]
MNKGFFLLILMIPIFSNSFAFKKKRKIKENISIEKAERMIASNHVRNKGRIYEIVVNTKMKNIIIDSLWFGATPVPCDVYDFATQQKQVGKLPVGKYLIRANQDLYKNYSNQIDSTSAYIQFQAPTIMKGILMIMYWENTNRKYMPIYHVTDKPQKPLRN